MLLRSRKYVRVRHKIWAITYPKHLGLSYAINNKTQSRVMLRREIMCKRLNASIRSKMLLGKSLTSLCLTHLRLKLFLVLVWFKDIVLIFYCFWIYLATNWAPSDVRRVWRNRNPELTTCVVIVCLLSGLLKSVASVLSGIWILIIKRAVLALTFKRSTFWRSVKVYS